MEEKKLIQFQNIVKDFDGTLVLKGINLDIYENEFVTLLGPSGCGKTTLLKIIAESESLDSGEIHKENRLSIGYLAQTTFVNETALVEDEMESAFENVKALARRLEELTEKMRSDHGDDVLNAYADAQQRFEEMGGYTYRSELMTIFTKFGFQEEDLKRPVSSFSGGQKTRLAFVKLLLSKPDKIGRASCRERV